MKGEPNTDLAFLVIYHGVPDHSVTRACPVVAQNAEEAKKKADIWFGWDKSLAWDRTVEDTPDQRYMINSSGSRSKEY